MSVRDDVQKYYNNYDYIQIAVIVSFWVNVIFSVITFVCSENVQVAFIVIQMIAIFINVICSWINNIIFVNAESARRRVNIDDSFGINSTEEKSIGYYNNNLSPSVKKLVVNNFESVYFTKHIIEKMVTSELIKGGVAIIVFIITMNIFPGNAILLLVFQLIFSGSYLIGLVNFMIFRREIKSIYESFYKDLITDKSNNNIKLIDLCRLSLEYEVLKGSYKVKLSSKIFMKQNQQLSNKWNDLQKQTIFYDVIG